MSFRTHIIYISIPVFFTDESLPYIALGENHLEETSCSKPVSLFVGDNATLYCNTSVILLCDAAGDPTPRISWVVNGETFTKEFENVNLLVQNNTLVLRSVSFQSGLYTCVASNVNGASNGSTSINYIGRYGRIFLPGLRLLTLLRLYF